jgi:hypothetical protein
MATEGVADTASSLKDKPTNAAAKTADFDQELVRLRI